MSTLIDVLGLKVVSMLFAGWANGYHTPQENSATLKIPAETPKEPETPQESSDTLSALKALCSQASTAQGETMDQEVKAQSAFTSVEKELTSNCP